MAYCIFISHGWTDRWVAAQMAKELNAAGIDAFVDIHDIALGDPIRAQVEAGIRKSQELVCLITPQSVRRNWLWTEMGMMAGQGGRVTAILYGVTLEQVRNEYGGLSLLNDANVADINAFDDYINQVLGRASIRPRPPKRKRR